ncbi:hypothetical protein M758_3G109600 [Ceratodon purpureus]|nr:hypothetical protein M758_3G109600 [Ceratodon purpureus]
MIRFTKPATITITITNTYKNAQHHTHTIDKIPGESTTCMLLLLECSLSLSQFISLTCKSSLGEDICCCGVPLALTVGQLTSLRHRPRCKSCYATVVAELRHSFGLSC